jgi:hypothetical protein
MAVEIVYVPSRGYGVLVTRLTSMSLIKFAHNDGEWDEEWIENDDYELWTDRSIDYERDE